MQPENEPAAATAAPADGSPPEAPALSRQQIADWLDQCGACWMGTRDGKTPHSTKPSDEPSASWAEHLRRGWLDKGRALWLAGEGSLCVVPGTLPTGTKDEWHVSCDFDNGDLEQNLTALAEHVRRPILVYRRPDGAPKAHVWTTSTSMPGNTGIYLDGVKVGDWRGRSKNGGSGGYVRCYEGEIEALIAAITQGGAYTPLTAAGIAHFSKRTRPDPGKTSRAPSCTGIGDPVRYMEAARGEDREIHGHLVQALTEAWNRDPDRTLGVVDAVKSAYLAHNPTTHGDPDQHFEEAAKSQRVFVEAHPKRGANLHASGFGAPPGSVADIVARVVAREVESVEARIARAIDQWVDDCTEHDEARRQVLRAQLRHDARIEEEAPDTSGYDPVDPNAMRSTGDYRAALDKVRFAKSGKGLATLLKEGVKALMHGATTDEVALAATGGDVKAYPEATLPQWLSDLDYAFVDVLARTNAERGAKAVSGALRGVLAKIKEAARKEHAADVEREQKRARYAGQPTPYADLSEATFTDALEKLGAAIRFNEIAHHAELSRDGGETWKHMDPELESRLQIDLENAFTFWAGKRTEALHWPEVKWARLVKAQFALAENRFHPIRAWLEGLRGRWDGTARLDGWLAECFIPAKQADPILQWAARYILMAVVRRSFCPGAKADEMPILKGAAGSGKSTALKYLLPPILHLAGFSDALGFQESSPAKWAELLEKASIVEAEECIGITQAKINAVKQFVGSTNDDRTDKWEKRKSLKPRNCIIVGTINAERDLPLDPSNRKMIVAELDLRRHARSAVGPIEEWFEQEIAPGLTRRDALWAEALHRVEAGESFAFPSELLDHLQERMAAHTDGGSFAEDIEALPSRKPNGLRWSFDDVLVELFGDMENRPYYPADAPSDTRRPIPYDPKETPPATCKAVSETMRRCGFVKMVFRGYMTEQDGTAHRPKITRYGRPEYETQALERLCADVHRAIGSLTRTDVPDGLTLENIVERAKVAKCRPMLFVSEMSRELFEAVRRCAWIRYSTLDGRYTDGPRRFWPKR